METRDYQGRWPSQRCFEREHLSQARNTRERPWWPLLEPSMPSLQGRSSNNNARLWMREDRSSVGGVPSPGKTAGKYSLLIIYTTRPIVYVLLFKHSRELLIHPNASIVVARNQQGARSSQFSFQWSLACHIPTVSGNWKAIISP